MTLKSSVEIFQALESPVSTTSVASMTSIASFHQKNYSFWWLDHPKHSKEQHLLRPVYVTFLKTGWCNSNFKTSWNYWSFYPSELIYFAHFNMRYPVGSCWFYLRPEFWNFINLLTYYIPTDHSKDLNWTQTFFIWNLGRLRGMINILLSIIEYCRQDL